MKIRLTESQIHNVIKESVKRIIREMDKDEEKESDWLGYDYDSTDYRYPERSGEIWNKFPYPDENTNVFGDSLVGIEDGYSLPEAGEDGIIDVYDEMDDPYNMDAKVYQMQNDWLNNDMQKRDRMNAGDVDMMMLRNNNVDDNGGRYAMYALSDDPEERCDGQSERSTIEDTLNNTF